MIKSELIEKVALANPHLFQRDVELIVNVIFEEIVDSLAQGERVELRGFGAFSVKRRPARVGRNPRTGEQVKVDEKYVPYFKTGKELRVRMNKHSETKSKVKSASKATTPVKKTAPAKANATAVKADAKQTKAAAESKPPVAPAKAKAPVKAKTPAKAKKTAV